MSYQEAEEYVHTYAGRAEEWLRKLEAFDLSKITKEEATDFLDVYKRAITVCKAAAGDQPALDHLVLNKEDGLNLGMSHWAVQLLTTSLVGSIEEEGGVNYLELELNGHPKGPLLVNIQFKEKKTPAMVAGEHKILIEELEAESKQKDEEIADLLIEIEGLEIALKEKDV